MKNFLKFKVKLAFEEVFTIALQHDYYSGGLANDLAIRASMKSEYLMRKLDLQHKSNSLGSTVGYKVGTQVLKAMERATEPMVLTFLIYNQNPAFVNFTDMPFPNEGMGFYFSNHAGTVTEGQPLLSAAEKAGAGDLIHFFGPVFEYQLSQAPETIKAKISNVTGKLIKEEETPSGGRAFYRVDLRDEPSGKYKLEIEGEQAFEFYRLDAKERFPFGAIDIYFDKNGHSDFRLLDDSGFVSRDYRIGFGARSTVWKYFIFDKTNANLFVNHQITDASKKIAFSAPEEEATKTGKTATCIRSAKGIPLKERPDHQFQLKVQRASGSNSEITIDLPNANPNMLTPGSENDPETFFSEIFIHV